MDDKNSALQFALAEVNPMHVPNAQSQSTGYFDVLRLAVEKSADLIGLGVGDRFHALSHALFVDFEPADTINRHWVGGEVKGLRNVRERALGLPDQLARLQ